ncbi:MAG TPA: branched-chain amino acid ABC transporter permease [Dehalococcoidia bacterium]|nr:branched-chain amino acid ABC transporter permease [Dehalococcoidia bacterium]
MNASRWAPAPWELAAMFGAGYFFWFLSDGALGAVVGAAGVAAAVVISRLAGMILPERHYPSKGVWALLILAFAVAAPFISAGDFRTTQMATAGYVALGVLGLNLLTGYTGQGSIGHSAFIGLGAYGTAIMVNQWDVPMVMALFTGAAVAAAAGLLIGIPALRLSGPYLAIATLGLAVAFTPIVKLAELSDLTGGRSGLNLFEHRFGPPVDWDWLSDSRWYYYVTLGSLIGGLLLLHNLLGSAVGRSFRAARDNEIAAAAAGVNVPLTKVTAFAISSAYAGFAGGLLFMISNRFVSPESFTVIMAIEYLVAMVIGGTASLSGSLFGAFFLVYVYREGIQTLTEDTEAGSDKWLFASGILLGGGLIFVGGGSTRVVRRIAGALGHYGQVAANLLRLAAVLVVAVAFVWLFRKATEDLLDLVSLRGAMTGTMLIVVVLFMPGGVASLFDRIFALKWVTVRDRLRAAIILRPAAAIPELPGETAGSATR